MFLVILALACGSPDDSPFGSNTGGGGGASGGDGSNPCPTGFVYVEADSTGLGEWDLDLLGQYEGNVVPYDSYDTAPFCIAKFPAPGTEGAAWPLDGLSIAQLPAVEQELDASARRLCTVPELLRASSGHDDWRHPYDAEDRGSVCEPDDANPSAIGTFSSCESPEGVRDFEVRSTWALLDDVTAAVLRDFWGDTLDGGGVYVAWGGTSRDDTYYAPSNFGVHMHGEDEDPYTDDGLRICLDPGVPTSDDDAIFADSMAALSAAGSFADWLSTR